MTDRFLICIPYSLAMECPHPNDWSNPANFSNDPRDPGGATMCGITQAEDNAWRSEHGEPLINVFNIPQAEGYTIYKQNYWLPHCPSLGPGLDLSYVDTSINQGPSAATKLLQTALKIEVDGVWGPITQAAAQTQVTPTLILAFTAARINAYYNYANFSVFGTGWLNRARAINTDSLSMLANPEGFKKTRTYVRAPRVYGGYGIRGKTVIK